MWSAMRPAMRRRGLATAAARALATRQRGLCTAGSSPLAGIRARAADAWEDALDAEWVDEPDIGLMTEGISQIVDDYRPLYSAEDVAGGGEAKEVYDEVARLYVAGEAARLTESYADHMAFVLREHMEMTGSLGNNTDLKPEEASRAEETLEEYVTFVNSIENVRVRRKTEAQLGRKAILLRQALSVEGFGAKHYPVATDHMITTRIQPKIPNE